jgi:hypothetical protein
MTAALLTFQPRKKAVPVPRYYVVRLSGGFDGMSRWHSFEEAMAAADTMREEFPEDEVAVLAPLAVC